MKKVLIIYKFLPQYRKEFFNELKRKLIKHNIELDLIYGKLGNINALKKDEVEIEWGRFIQNRRLKIGKTELIWQPCLKHLRDNDLIIVESANKLILNYYLMFFRYFAKYKLAFWGHGRNMQNYPNNLRNKFNNLFINKCDWWFAYTKGVKQYLLNHNYPESKITIVQNAIDTFILRKYYSDIKEKEINDLKDQLSIKNCKTGIYCGAMYPDKKLDFILETCHKVKKEIPEFNMIFIGSGIDSYKAQDASNTYNWIHYVGPKFDSDRTKYFKISSIQLMPGVVGLGILDSFAMETPMITTSNLFHGPEIEYLENGINGIITNDNIDDYSNSVIEVLRNEKYLKLIDGCKLSAEKYTVEIMVENFKNGILSCLDS